MNRKSFGVTVARWQFQKFIFIWLWMNVKQMPSHLHRYTWPTLTHNYWCFWIRISLLFYGLFVCIFSHHHFSLAVVAAVAHATLSHTHIILSDRITFIISKGKLKICGWRPCQCERISVRRAWLFVYYRSKKISNITAVCFVCKIASGPRCKNTKWTSVEHRPPSE